MIADIPDRAELANVSVNIRVIRGFFMYLPSIWIGFEPFMLPPR